MKERVCASEVEQFTHPKLALNDSFPTVALGFFPLCNVEKGWKNGGKGAEKQEERGGRMVSTHSSCEN